MSISSSSSSTSSPTVDQSSSLSSLSSNVSFQSLDGREISIWQRSGGNSSSSLDSITKKMISLNWSSNAKMQSDFGRRLLEESKNFGQLKHLTLILTNPFNPQQKLTKNFLVCLLKNNLEAEPNIFNTMSDFKSAIAPKANDSEATTTPHPNASLDLDLLLEHGGAKFKEDLALYPQILDAYEAYRIGQPHSLSLPEEALQTIVEFSDLICDHLFAVSAGISVQILQSKNFSQFTHVLFDHVILGDMAMDEDSPHYILFENFITNPHAWKSVLTEEKVKQLQEAARKQHPPAVAALFVYQEIDQNNQKLMDLTNFNEMLYAEDNDHILWQTLQYFKHAFHFDKFENGGFLVHSPFTSWILSKKGDLASAPLKIKLLKESAEKGNVYAMFDLAHCYQEGLGVQKDPKLSFEWYQKAAQANLPEAMSMLVMCYDRGFGTDPDSKLAFKWEQKAAQANRPGAMHALAWRYEEGLGTDKDPKLAFAWYQKATQANVSSAMYRLANCYGYGIGTDPDPKLAFEWYQKAAQENEYPAMYPLAEFYAFGIGTDKDPKLAFEWYQKAAQGNQSSAMLRLVECYQNGFGTDKDPKLAFEWCKKAAEANSPRAMYRLARYYREGFGTYTDLKSKLAFEWYQRAAESMYFHLFTIKANSFGLQEQEVGQAMYDLAECYAYGSGTDKDLKLAFEWYQKAAQANLPQAMYKLATCYNNGFGSADKDPKLAFEWLQKAAQAKWPQAEQDLARILQIKNKQNETQS